MVNQFIIGSYEYLASPLWYDLCPSNWSDPNDSVKTFDRELCLWLNKLFRERCTSSDQIKAFLRGLERDADQSFMTSKLQILEQEPLLREHFSSREELAKLSLLWITILAGYNESAELLVRSGADVDEIYGSRDPQIVNEKWTVLHVLLHMNPSPENERLVRLVAEHSTDLEARDSWKRTAMHIAKTKGLVEILIERGADLHARDTWSQTALHYAARHDRVDVIELLLEKGADINVADNHGATPLLTAALTKKAAELLPILTELGADIFVKDIYGCHVVHRLTMGVEQQRSADLARFFIEKGVPIHDRTYRNQYQLIHLAAMSGNNDLVNLYLDKGLNVNSLAKGISPLYIAARNYSPSAVIESLIKRGADVHHKRSLFERTPLHGACMTFSPDEKSIKLLLSAGADVLVEDCQGKTPLALIKHDNMEKAGSCLILKKLALIKVYHPSLELKDETIIKKYPKLCDYYGTCIQQIQRSKSVRFIESCTFYDLLTKCHCQIAALMRNPIFDKRFKFYYGRRKRKFTAHCAEDIVQAFERSEKYFRSLVKQEKVIKKGFYGKLPDVVMRIVVRYLLNHRCSSVAAIRTKVKKVKT